MNIIINKNLVKIFFLSLSLVVLGGCNALNTKTEEQQEPVDLLALREQANEAYIKDDFANAEKYYETLVRELPEEPEHWFRLANIYVATDRPYSSMGLYREAVIRDPKFTKAWYNLGIVQLKQTAFSLNEMLTYTNKQDPLYSKAAEMLEEIKAIINSN